MARAKTPMPFLGSSPAPNHLIDDPIKPAIAVMNEPNAATHWIGEYQAADAEPLIVKPAEVVPSAKLDGSCEPRRARSLIVFVLSFTNQKGRVLDAEVYPRRVLDFCQSAKPCPGGIAIEQGSEERDLVARSRFQTNAGRCQRVIGSASARKIRHHDIRPAECAVEVGCGELAYYEF